LDFKTEKKEIELINRDDFKNKLKNMTDLKITNADLDCILLLLGKQNFSDKIQVKDLQHVFYEMGIREPIPKKNGNLHFSTLDNKSIRILNRLNEFLESHSLKVEEFFRTCSLTRKIKLKGQS
jgi:hypothetical protein